MAKLTPEEAQELLEALLESDLLSVECDNCGKTIRDHTDEEIRICDGQV